jgi:hypothetical protein
LVCYSAVTRVEPAASNRIQGEEYGITLFCNRSRGALAAMAASSAGSSPPLPRFRAAAVAPGNAPLRVVGTRSAEQRRSASNGRLDSVLSDLSRHAGKARTDHALADLHSLSPAARISISRLTGKPLVLVDAVTRGDPRQLEAAMQQLGLERAARYSNDVGGWLPVDQLAAAAARDEVASIRAAMPHTSAAAGTVSTQGDFAQGSDAARAAYPTLTGTGDAARRRLPRTPPPSAP